MTEGERLGPGILRYSTSRTDKTWSSRHKGCIRTTHPVSYDRRVIAGSLVPAEKISFGSGEGQIGGYWSTHVFGFSFALKVGLNGFVLFVELGEVRNQVFHYIGVG